MNIRRGVEHDGRVQPQRTATGSEARPVHALAWAVAAIPVAATVATYGELTIQAFVAVLVSGGVLTAAALRRRAGSAAPAVPGAVVWLVWLVAVGLWELYTFLHQQRLPTLSDLTDPILAHPLVRGAATVAWFSAGIWLLRRPTSATTSLGEESARSHQ